MLAAMTSSSRGAVAVSLGLKDASESVLFWDIATAGEQDPKFGDSENTQSTKTPCFSTEVYYHQVFSQNALLLKCLFEIRHVTKHDGIFYSLFI